MMQEARTRIMGIVNLTPDSFSDGGRFDSAKAALLHMEQLLADGADVLDVGAESTRPGATELTPNEEWKRLEEVLSTARAQFPEAVLSVDTRHPETAKRALEVGVDWINDVAGGTGVMMKAVADADCRFVVMHSLSVPADPTQVLPEGIDVVQAVHHWAVEKLQTFVDAGIAQERIVLDPGIGFGKTAEQSWSLVNNINKLQKLRVDWLIGHSRKSFFKLLGDEPAEARDLQTHVVSAWLMRQGVDYLRVHDVAGTRRALSVAGKLQEGGAW